MTSVPVLGVATLCAFDGRLEGGVNHFSTKRLKMGTFFPLPGGGSPRPFVAAVSPRLCAPSPGGGAAADGRSLLVS